MKVEGGGGSYYYIGKFDRRNVSKVERGIVGVIWGTSKYIGVLFNTGHISHSQVESRNLSR